MSDDVRVDLGLAVRHPLGDRLGDARALLDPHRGARPEASHLGRLAEHRHPVGRQREQAVDRVLHADRLVADDLRHQLERVLHLLVEVVLRERQLRRRQRGGLDRGDVVGVVQDRPVGVRADLQSDAVLALVHVACPCRGRSGTRSCRVELGEPRHRARCRSSGGRPASAGSTRRPSARSRGLQTPQAMTTISASMSPRVGAHAADAAVARRRCRAPRCWPRRVSAPASTARSRMIVPARSESTTPTPGE